MKTHSILFLIVLSVIRPTAVAQDSTSAPIKDDNKTILETKSMLDALKKIKISGYIQAQYQFAESNRISSFAGGDSPFSVHDRFQVRRGRFKINYDNELTQYVLQINVTQNGVGIVDAYASVKEPWLGMFTLTAGIFYRPFGFEISYSSSNRESPERSRLFQTLFPGERDLGAKLEIAPEKGPLRYFNLRAGVFNGVSGTANENDRNKDFIGRLGFHVPFDEQHLVIQGGSSLYAGKVTNFSQFVYSIDKTLSVKQYAVSSTISNVGATFEREYYGIDAQMYYDFPSIGRLSLRGEYIAGKQPGTETSNSFYNREFGPQPLYFRKFNGWYLSGVQNIGEKCQFVVKYDVLDPNTDVEAEDIGVLGSNLTVVDIRYSTLGFGWIYHWDTNVKFTVYYDIIMNEKVDPSATGSLASFKEDLKDNVLTLRMQYKF